MIYFLIIIFNLKTLLIQKNNLIYFKLLLILSTNSYFLKVHFFDYFLHYCIKYYHAKIMIINFYKNKILYFYYKIKYKIKIFINK